MIDTIKNATIPQFQLSTIQILTNHPESTATPDQKKFSENRLPMNEDVLAQLKEEYAKSTQFQKFEIGLDPRLQVAKRPDEMSKFAKAVR